MASGGIVINDGQRFLAIALDGVTGTSLGAWIELPPLVSSSIYFDAYEAGAVFTLGRANSIIRPLDSFNGLVSAIALPSSPPGIHLSPTSTRWVKVIKTQGASPVPTTAILFGNRI